MAHVLGVLRRHGFADLLRGGGRWPPPERVRATLEELGVVYVKFGQILSTRRDLIPEEYIEALEGLQDRMEALPPTTVAEIIQEELGEGPEDLFATFDEKPLATASIAQVHAATLKEGRDVVVKVQRPGLQERVAEDMLVLGQIAGGLDALSSRARMFDLPQLVREFRTSLLAELDFRNEAWNIRRFEASLARDPTVWIPPVVEEFTTSRVLVMERSRGVRLDRYLQQEPEMGTELARRLGHLFIGQVFRDGLFHADPHPGNFFVLEEGVLCLHDFGMVGELDEKMREALVDLLEATVAGDARRATHAYLDLGLVPGNVDRGALEAEIGRLVADVRSRPLKEVSVGRALEALARIGGRHRVPTPGTFMLLSRAFVTLEGVMARLDPELSFIEIFGKAMDEVVGIHFTPDRIQRDGIALARSLDHFLRESPEDLRRVLRSWADGRVGQVTVQWDQEEAEARRRTHAAVRRLAAAGFLALAGGVLSLHSGGWGDVGAGLAAVGVLVLLRYLIRP
ncbi:MAG: ABC1 kinase family protein [Gemmatimonadota bacterium]